MPQCDDALQQDVRDERDQKWAQEALREAARQEREPCQQQPQQMLNLHHKLTEKCGQKQGLWLPPKQNKLALPN